MGPKPKFQDNEKVLCFHGPLLYEAKCVKSEVRERTLHYFVHYNGWNKNWDEWVPETRILKLNDAGLQKQKECLNQLKAEKARDRQKAREAKELGLPIPGKKEKKKDKEAKDRSGTPTTDGRSKQKGVNVIDAEKDKDKHSSAATSGKSTPVPASGKSTPVPAPGKSTPSAASTKSTPNAPSIKSEKAAATGKSTPVATSGKSKRERVQETPVEKERASRSSTPTPSTTSSKRTKDRDREAEKDRSSRSSTPTTQQPAKRQKTDRAAATAAASQIAQQSAAALEKEKEKLAPTTPASSSQESSSSLSTPATPNLSSQSSTSEQKRKRARLDQTIENEESYLTKIEVKVKIPEELKPWLVDDWDIVTRQHQLVSLPCRHTVNSILDDYLQLKLTKPNHPDRDIIIEVNNGIREYFNAMLGTQLLYKFERPQYGQVLTEQDTKEMSSVYGATHLLRLFVKLGSMLAYTALDEKSIQILLHHIHDFLKYLQRNASTLFTQSDYFVAPPEYHRKAM